MHTIYWLHPSLQPCHQEARCHQAICLNPQQTRHWLEDNKYDLQIFSKSLTMACVKWHMLSGVSDGTIAWRNDCARTSYESGYSWTTMNYSIQQFLCFESWFKHMQRYMINSLQRYFAKVVKPLLLDWETSRLKLSYPHGGTHIYTRRLDCNSANKTAYIYVSS